MDDGLTCHSCLTLAAKAPAACECVDEDAGCCNEDCSIDRNLPPCKCCKFSDRIGCGVGGIYNIDELLLALGVFFFAVVLLQGVVCFIYCFSEGIEYNLE